MPEITNIQLENLTLYVRPLCGYCTRVVRWLEETGVLHAVHQEDIAKNKDAHIELLNGGGKGQVPALKINDNGSPRWMYESLDIIDYIGQILNKSK